MNAIPGLNAHLADLAAGERALDEAHLALLEPEGTHQAVCDAIGKGELLNELEAFFRQPNDLTAKALRNAMEAALDNWAELEAMRLMERR